MDLRSTVKLAFFGLKSKKTRTFLTMLGIIIGISSVIIIISVGSGAQSLILNQIKSFGSNMISIFPGASEESGPPPSVFGSVNTDMKLADVEALLDQRTAPNVIAVTAYVRGVTTFVWRSNQFDGTFVGTTTGYPFVHDAEVRLGRFFDKDEEKNLGRVAVLGYESARELFGDQDPLNQNIKIKKLEFKVIGVMPKRGTEGFENTDRLVFIPISTAQKILLGIDYVSIVRVKIDDTANTEQAVEDIRYILRDRHNLAANELDDFSIRPLSQAIEIFSAITNSLTYFLAAIAAISLLVGGIGIMNIMLITVAERTKEIGLRKALGAKNRNILHQFLVESMAVTFVGGLIGVLAGIFISLFVALIARQLGYDWDFVVSFWAIILACAISILVGLVFGSYPALRASKLNPIEALHYE